MADVYAVFATEVDGRSRASRLEFEDGKLLLASFGCGHAAADLVQCRDQTLEALVPLPAFARLGSEGATSWN